ncbi:response regulator [Paenibacillus alkalitolerans]|uniref:response regulator n=1 Tax=Paenibacillus alkalitolerans TaxID=2799335 RepID=UPI0018F44268|nr:response regulator [Paenibacillus alkalitolerans]
MADKPMTVLVVDDEIPLRQELRAFPWESCGAVVIGEAENGEDALQKCHEHVPDVVVTDIAMPIMDGLTLIRELRSAYPSVQVILLTCHSEFQYAQEAIRLGALEYILKVSMDEAELKQALMKAKQAFERERSVRNNEKSKRRTLQSKLVGNLLKELNNADSYTKTDVSLSDSDWGLLGLGTETLCRIVRLFIDIPIGEFVFVQEDIQAVIDTFEKEYPDCVAWVSVTGDELFIMFSRSGSVADMERMVERLFRQLTSEYERNVCNAETDLIMHAVISEPIRNRTDFIEALYTTSLWKEARFYDGDTSRNIFDGEPIPMAEMTDEHKKQLFENIRKASWDTDKLCAYFQHDFSVWCVKQRIRPNQLKQWLFNWRLQRLHEQDGLLKDGSIHVQLTEAQTLRSLISLLVKDFQSAGGKAERMRVEIREAKQWIKDNLKQDISVPAIAERVGLSPQYVSRLFKEETGESVNRYITRLRMEKAIDLLKNTNKKVYEVAEEVGIPSYRYFTVTFRNWTGVAPTDFKRLGGASDNS